MIKFKNKYSAEKFFGSIRSEYKLSAHIGPYALIYCMVKGK